MFKIILLCLVGSFIYTTAQDVSNETIEYGKFDLKIFKKIVNLGIKNTVISPVSLKISMAILNEAAAGKTKLEIQKALKFSHNQSSVRHQFDFMLKTLQSTNQLYELNLGPIMYLDESIRRTQKYVAILSHGYNARIVKFNKSNLFQSVDEANKWIQKFTHQNIEQIVSEEDFRDTVLLLLDSIYFKGIWKNQFPVNQTQSGKFNVNSTYAITTRFMKQIDGFEYYYSEDLEAKIIKLPYQGENIAMYVMLPDSIDGLSELICGLNAQSIRRTMLMMKKSLVNLTMPKFKMDYTAPLMTPLKEMGIHSIFDKTASLPALARGKDLRLTVSSIIHKIGFGINELGSTPLTDLGVTLDKKNEQNLDQVEFKATRPFLFFLHEKVTNQLLFIGTVDHPMTSRIL